jgi:outer membrane protein assembly factor BamA
MKKILLILLTLGTIPHTLTAHNISTGTIEVEGGANFSFSSVEIDKGRDKDDIDKTELSLTSLYYISPNLGVGLHWSYESTEHDGNDDAETIMGPALAFNIPIAPKMSVKPFGYIALVDGEEGTIDYDGTEWGLGTTLNYFIQENISLNAGLLYSSQDLDIDNGGDYKKTGFKTNLGLSVYF